MIDNSQSPCWYQTKVQNHVCEYIHYLKKKFKISETDSKVGTCTKILKIVSLKHIFNCKFNRQKYIKKISKNLNINATLWWKYVPK